jgi:hypothetical protein
MLRFGFLPSDFNPMVLMLGETRELSALAAMLRRFAREPTEIRMETLDFCAAANQTRIALAPATDAPVGLRRLPGPRNAFIWRLDPADAARLAARIDELAHPDRHAGSDILEEGEIALKVSRGEYTEDFLHG